MNNMFEKNGYKANLKQYQFTSTEKLGLVLMIIMFLATCIK
jgi:hypothetical protein